MIASINQALIRGKENERSPFSRSFLGRIKGEAIEPAYEAVTCDFNLINLPLNDRPRNRPTKEING